MEINRRTLLRAAAGTAVAGFVPLHFAEVAGAAVTSPKLDMATFQRQLNTSFKFVVGSRTVAMPLKAVVDERTAAAKATPGAGEAFSLMFAGSLPTFAQGTYRVDHNKLGRLSLFVVPVGRATTGQEYQVAFNHCMA